MNFRASKKINILLFIITLITTTAAGAIQKGLNPIASFSNFFSGLSFSLTLMLILTVHEFGHYLMAKKHDVYATLPYFIPAPSLIGTFGAFIKMSPYVPDRKALIDIGATGPLAGFIIAVPTLIIGLYMSEIKYVAEISRQGLGTSLLVEGATKLIWGNLPDNADIILHPVGFAGWIGLFVTAMNMVPVGQMDGGHIFYALFGKRNHRITSIISIALLFLVGLFYWKGWLFWGVLMLVMGFKHPEPIAFEEPLDLKRKKLGIFSFLIFIITFVPVPFMGIEF